MNFKLHQFHLVWITITMLLLAYVFTKKGSEKSTHSLVWDSIMNLTRYLSVVLLLLLCAAWTPVGASVGSKQSKPWRAVHLLDYNSDSALDALGQNLENLAKQGVNVIILEVDYNFASPQRLPSLRPHAGCVSK